MKEKQFIKIMEVTKINYNEFIGNKNKDRK